MPSTIILIGPIGVGKSTIGQLLAQRLDLPQCSMDEKRWDYYREIGYDEDLAKYKRETEGFWVFTNTGNHLKLMRLSDFCQRIRTA